MHSVSISMKKQLVKINLKKVNLVATITFFIPLIFGIVLQWLFFNDKIFKIAIWDIIILIIGYPVLVIIHELIHGICFLITGANIKDIRFGIIPKKMMVYCTSKKPLSVSSYKVTLLMPLILTGIIPFILSIFYLNVLYVLLFALLISAASGDLMMFFKLTKYRLVKLVLDHPSAPAFYLLYDENNLPEDFVEATLEDERKLLDEINSK